jgi:hypothetical protein
MGHALNIKLKKTPGICLTTEKKERKTLSQGSRRMSVGMMKYRTKSNLWKESQSITEAYVCDSSYKFVTGAVCL